MVAVAAGDVGGSQAEAREADVVVAPIRAEAVDIGRTVPVIELGTEQNIDGQPVPRGAAAESAGGNAVGSRQTGDFLDRPDLREDLTVAWNENAHIVMVPQRPWQCGGYFAETTGFDVICNLGCDEENRLPSLDGDGRLDAAL